MKFVAQSPPAVQRNFAGDNAMHSRGRLCHTQYLTDLFTTLGTSAISSLILGVQPFEFDSGRLNSELPIHCFGVVVSRLLPSRDFCV